MVGEQSGLEVFNPAAELYMQNVSDHLGGKRTTDCSTLRYSIMKVRWVAQSQGRLKEVGDRSTSAS